MCDAPFCCMLVSGVVGGEDGGWGGVWSASETSGDCLRFFDFFADEDLLLVGEGTGLSSVSSGNRSFDHPVVNSVNEMI